MLSHRLISAIILVPIFLVLLFFLPPLAFGIFTALVTLLAAWEWSRLVGIKHTIFRFFYLLLSVFLMVLSVFTHVVIIFDIALLGWLSALLMIIYYPRGSEWWSKHIFWRALMGVFVLIPCWVAINFIRGNFGIDALLFLFVLIWGADTAAYVVGKKWGKTKLAPIVSPGKSVQGLFGALIFTIIVASITEWFTQVPSRLFPWGILLSIITVLFSVVGDLFESMLKRQAGLKDSGNLIPGHGGLLDRIDSLTAAAPIFALGAILLGWYLA